MEQMLAGHKEQIIENHFHQNCFACGSNNGMGLGLSFTNMKMGVFLEISLQTRSTKAIQASFMEEL